MKKSDVIIGATYLVRWHDGSFTEVRIDGEKRINVRSRDIYGSGVIGTKTQYVATNLKTGRTVTIKSAAKLRKQVSAP